MARKAIDRDVKALPPFANHVTLMGEAITDPEFNVLPSGLAATRFKMHTVRMTRKGRRGECYIWAKFVGEPAVMVHRYKKKGDFVLVEGELVSKVFVDRTGHNRWIHVVQCKRIQFLWPAPKTFLKGHVMITREDYERLQVMEEYTVPEDLLAQLEEDLLPPPEENLVEDQDWDRMAKYGHRENK